MSAGRPLARLMSPSHRPASLSDPNAPATGTEPSPRSRLLSRGLPRHSLSQRLGKIGSNAGRAPAIERRKTGTAHVEPLYRIVQQRFDLSKNIFIRHGGCHAKRDSHAGIVECAG